MQAGRRAEYNPAMRIVRFAGISLAIMAAALIPSGLAGCAGPGEPASIAEGLQSDQPVTRTKACIRAGDARDASVVALLVDRLEDPEDEVRMFAIRALDRITGQTLGYQWSQDADARKASVERWRQWLTARAGGGPVPSSARGGP